MDRQRRGYLDDQRMHAFERDIAARAGRRAHIGGELPPERLDAQIDAKFGHGTLCLAPHARRAARRAAPSELRQEGRLPISRFRTA
jgi:hypothetical protein